MRIFMAPACYIQGPGAMARLPEVARRHGESPWLIADAGIMAMLEPELRASFGAAGLALRLQAFEGEITHTRLDALAAHARPEQPSVVVGIGGGKVLDVAKGVALRLGLQMISVPTIASTDAPASRGIVIYHDDHSLAGVEQMPRNPDCVLVDTDWIARAPARFLSAGIGDAIAKKFEADACLTSGGRNKHGTPPSLTAMAVAEACYTTLRAHGPAAMRACAAKTPDAALESVVETCVLMSALAFENGGLSLAHAMALGLTQARGVAQRLHGEHVAYGLLVQFALEGRDDATILDMAAFYRSVALPVSLAELDMQEPTEAELTEIARANLASPRPPNTTVVLDLPTVVQAFRRVEELVAQV
jgi:glycerol dehydrogenase